MTETAHRVIVRAGQLLQGRAGRLHAMAKLFSASSFNALADTLPREPTTQELDRMAEILARRCIETVLAPAEVPSKGSLRDAAKAAGLEAIREVLSNG